ncbi:MAG: hypothetical protein H6707_01835 [Deltaproteobacteria bacterium]|nr:hypothetical protein [Deltaproteobacteria bacterium]
MKQLYPVVWAISAMLAGTGCGAVSAETSGGVAQGKGEPVCSGVRQTRRVVSDELSEDGLAFINTWDACNDDNVLDHDELQDALGYSREAFLSQFAALSAADRAELLAGSNPHNKKLWISREGVYRQALVNKHRALIRPYSQAAADAALFGYSSYSYGGQSHPLVLKDYTNNYRQDGDEAPLDGLTWAEGKHVDTMAFGEALAAQVGIDGEEVAMMLASLVLVATPATGHSAT